MQTKYRIATEQIAIALVFMISLVVSDYVLKTVLHIPAQDALFTIIVTAILALPPYVLGNFVGFRKYYIKQIHGLGLSKLEYKAGSNLALIGALISAVAGFLYFTYFSIVHGSFVFAILHLCPAVALIWLIVRLWRRIPGYLKESSAMGQESVEISNRRIFLLTIRLETLAIPAAASILSGFYLLITARYIGLGIFLFVLGVVLGVLVFKMAEKGVREFSIE